MSAEEVILVDENDVPIGKMEKLEAHKLGKLHRAFSVFVFNSRGEFLIQRRAQTKYHSGGLWSNTCCGHPRPGEDTTGAAERRLNEESGLRLRLTPLFVFSYQTEFKDGLIEHEIDHVFKGLSDEFPEPNPMEVEEWRFINKEALLLEVNTFPERFTFWFRICLNRLLD